MYACCVIWYDRNQILFIFTVAILKPSAWLITSLLTLSEITSPQIRVLEKEKGEKKKFDVFSFLLHIW